MPTITKRELNQQTAAVLDRVSDSEDVIVTERTPTGSVLDAAARIQTVLDGHPVAAVPMAGEPRRAPAASTGLPAAICQPSERGALEIVRVRGTLF